MSRLYKRWIWMMILLALLIVSLVLAACGGGDDEPTAPTPDTIVQTAAAASPTPRYPPTWTPRPTNTALPRATITYTYVPGPTGSPVYLPTRGPTKIPPTIDPVALTVEAQQSNLVNVAVAGAHTTILIAPSLVEAETANVVESVVGLYISEPPAVTFEDEHIIVNMTIIVGTENAGPRPVTVEATLDLDRVGELHLAVKDAYFTDDDEPYNEAIADFMVGAVDTALNTVLQDRYQLLNPGTSTFEVIEFELSENELSVETESTLPTPTPTPVAEG